MNILTALRSLFTPSSRSSRLLPSRRSGLVFGLSAGLCAALAAHAQGVATEAPEYWQGTLSIEAQQGKACSETSSGQSLPYSKEIRLRLQTDTRGRTQGFAWGDMLPTRLATLVIPAATRQGGPADTEVVGPPNILTLTWLPSRGALSPGQLSLRAQLNFEKKGDVLVGRWRERMAEDAVPEEQCLWSEAQVHLTRVPQAQTPEMAAQARSLQSSLALMDAQGGLPAAQRWSPDAVQQLLAVLEGLDRNGIVARTLMPLTAKLAEQVALNQSGTAARPLLKLTVQWLEAQMEQRPLEMAAYVTHMTPTLRAGAMLNEAEQLNRKAVAALVDKGHGQSTELARLLSGYGAVLMRMNAGGRALQVYEQALVIERVLKDGKHVGVVIALVNLSRVCETLGQTTRARELAEEASQVHEALGLGPLKTGPATRGGATAI